MIKKRIITGIIGICLVLAATGLVLAQNKAEERATGDTSKLVPEAVEEKTFFTKANIFYEKPLKIYSTNYHKGTILPAGTKVTITFAEGTEIEFKDEKGTKFILILRKKHSSESMTLKKYFDQYFSPENPLAPGGPYIAFNDSERWNIKNGTIEKGMSRAAVLMAYGYPPSHETPDLKDDKWTYWRATMSRPLLVFFRNDRVYKIVNSGTLESD